MRAQFRGEAWVVQREAQNVRSSGMAAKQERRPGTLFGFPGSDNSSESYSLICPQVSRSLPPYGLLICFEVWTQSLFNIGQCTT